MVNNEPILNLRNETNGQRKKRGRETNPETDS